MNSIVLLFGCADTSSALVDPDSEQHEELNAALTIEISIVFPMYEVDRDDWWYVLRTDLEDFLRWWWNDSDGFPTLILDLDA